MNKCESCNGNKMREVMNQIQGRLKTVSIYMCIECGTVYIGTTLNGNFSQGIPDNAIIKNGMVYMAVKSVATLNYIGEL